MKMINVFEWEAQFDDPLWDTWLSSGDLCRDVSKTLVFATADTTGWSIEREDFD